MRAQTNTLRRYVQETLGLDIHPVPWAGQDRLPLLLRDHYRFFQGRILGVTCVLMMDFGDEEQSPATIRKHMEKVQACWDGPVIYVRERITGYNRKRLIESKVPFVVPGNQMYLPMVGIDLRDHFRRLRSQSQEFSPSAQVVLISWLLSGENEVLTPSAMAERLGYSPMTMTRAFDELEASRLGESATRGRERCMMLSEPKRELWSKAQPLLRSPVRKRFHIRASDTPSPNVRAGLTALAQYTMLAEPSRPIFAVRDRGWAETRQQHEASIVPEHEPQACEIEIWSYDPNLFAENGLADRLSLYLSLRGTQDERVEAALENMLEDLPW